MVVHLTGGSPPKFYFNRVEADDNTTFWRVTDMLPFERKCHALIVI